MIHAAGTFEYKAEFKAEGFRGSDVVLHGETVHGDTIKRLVGHRPLIRFWSDRLIIVASDQPSAFVRNVSFRIGDSVPLLARPGDQLYLVRTGAGGFGLSLLRQEKLLLAIGAANAVPLGTEFRVFRRPKRYGPIGSLFNERLEFRVGTDQLIVRKREVTELGGYYIYVERCWEDGIPGSDECVSVCETNSETIKFAAMRSAILLATGYLKMTNWDCIEDISE